MLNSQSVNEQKLNLFYRDFDDACGELKTALNAEAIC